MARKPSQKKTPTYQAVQKILRDKSWHCRGHAFAGIPSRQLAGGGGFQTLERGTRSRAAWVLARKKAHCKHCGKKTDHIRWTGKEKPANAPAAMPCELIEQVLKYYLYTDVIELRERPRHQLVIDHRFPMIRWGGPESPLPKTMPETEIETKFQLLKKDDGGNHNSLKTRACQKCFETNKRGTPFGLRFFYEGDEDWDSAIPPIGPDAEQGCKGCGWYDFNRWRIALNGVHMSRNLRHGTAKRAKRRG
jgi:hypothetical protein